MAAGKAHNTFLETGVWQCQVSQAFGQCVGYAGCDQGYSAATSSPMLTGQRNKAWGGTKKS